MNFPLAGNGKIRLALENALKEHRIPHAILIDGDSGTGRHTLARFITHAVICSGEEIPCGKCANCRAASSDNHPDITVIAPEDGKKNIAVAQIRQMRADAFVKPHLSKSKVFIIDCADTMNEQSQNALLKVLEEPPGSTVFILIAESKAAMLDTIISRCVILTLNSPTENEGLEYIRANSEYDEADIEEALENTRNNIGKALLLLKGESDTKTSVAAKEFVKYMLSGNEWEMLKAVSIFEKNRPLAGGFFKDLKLAVAGEIKKNPRSLKAVALSGFYNEIKTLEESLITNISLPLLFADLTSRAKEYITR